VGVAEVAGIYGLYFAVPAIVAWCLDAVRSHLSHIVQRTLGGLILLGAIPYIAFWLLWVWPLFIAPVPPATVVLIVAVRLPRARSSDARTATRSANPPQAANASH
jgi:hypothetical protein